jgi:hypothetical protein
MFNTMFNHVYSNTAPCGISGLSMNDTESTKEHTMKLYYCTQDITPNEQDYFIGADGSADMVTPVYFKAQVIDWTTAKRIRELHGADMTAVVTLDTAVFGAMFKVTKIISFVDDIGCTHSHRYYIPAL